MEESLHAPLLPRDPADEVSPAAGDGRDALAAGDGGKIDGQRTSDDRDDSAPSTSDHKPALPEEGPGFAAVAAGQSGGSPPSHEGGDPDEQNIDDDAAGHGQNTFAGLVEEVSGGRPHPVEDHDSEERNLERRDDAAGRLDDAAGRAPPREAALAAVAVNLTGNSHESSSSESSDEQASRRCAFFRSWLHRARTAIFGPEPEPRLPQHRLVQRQEKLSDRRQALFGVALAASLALLTAAATAGEKNKIFPSGVGPWIAVISAVLWIGVSCGLVMDLFAKTRFEFQVASCLSRLGMMGVTALFCLFIFGAFFPSATIVMWIIVAAAVTLHALLCILSRKRNGDTNNEPARCSGCGCTCTCSLDV